MVRYWSYVWWCGTGLTCGGTPPRAHVLVHKCDSVVRVNISWGWLGGQGPVCRALVGAGTFAHAPCQGSIDEPILLILYSLFGVPQGMV